MIRQKNLPKLDDPRDRALAEQITIGVIKNLLHLEFLMEQFSGRPLKSIDPLVRKILAVALYQLRFLDRIPARAAVDEAVEQTRRFGRRHASGFVNAVLRKAAMAGPTQVGPTPSSAIGPPSAADITPARAAETAAVQLSHPPDLFHRLADLLGPKAALNQCRIHNTEPPTILRLFPGRTLADLPKEIAATPHEQPGFAILPSPTRPLLARLAREGIGQVQDPTSAAVVSALGANPGQRILDRCCGMGTKTIQLVEAAGPDAMIVAMDRSPARCGRLRETLRERGIANVEVIVGEWLQSRTTGESTLVPPVPPFNTILIDAPCSNSGVLARRPEARYAQSESHIRDLIHLQDQIIDDTLPALLPGGRLIYSTCSLWPEENQARVQRMLERHPDLTFKQDRLTLPAATDNPVTWHDGGYWAFLQKK